MTIRKKISLVQGKGRTQRLDDTTITEEAEYSINFSGSGWKFCLGLHYSESKSFLFVNAAKICQFKAKDLNFKIFYSQWHEKTGSNVYMYSFSVDYDIIYNSNIINIHEYLMQTRDIK